MATQVSYKDPYGNIQTGYIKDGRTYKDEAGTVRIDPGSKVTTADGKTYTYYGNANSSGSTGKSKAQNTWNQMGTTVKNAWNTVSNMADQLQTAQQKQNQQPENQLWYQMYQKAEAEAKRAEEAKIQQIVNQIEGRIPKTNEAYDDLAKQSYINYRLGEQRLKENLSALGLSGTGAAESTLLDANNQYQNTVNEGEMARQEAVNQLYQDIENARLTGATNSAQIESVYLSNLANLLYGQNQWQQQFDYQKMLDDRNFNYQKGLDDKAWDMQQSQWDYQKNRDAIEDERYKEQWAYTTNQDEYNQKLAFAPAAPLWSSSAGRSSSPPGPPPG